MKIIEILYFLDFLDFLAILEILDFLDTLDFLAILTSQELAPIIYQLFLWECYRRSIKFSAVRALANLYQHILYRLRRKTDRIGVAGRDGERAGDAVGWQIRNVGA